MLIWSPPPRQRGGAELAAAKASEDLTQKEKDLCIGMIATIAKPTSDGGGRQSCPETLRILPLSVPHNRDQGF